MKICYFPMIEKRILFFLKVRGGMLKLKDFPLLLIQFYTVLYIRTENLIRLRHKSEEVYTVVCKIISFSTAYSVEMEFTTVLHSTQVRILSNIMQRISIPLALNHHIIQYTVRVCPPQLRFVQVW